MPEAGKFDPYPDSEIEIVTQTRLACDSENKHGAGLKYGELRN